MVKSVTTTGLAFGLAIASAQQLDWIYQVKNKPFLDAREYNFPAQRPGGTLASGVPATVTLRPCPKGVIAGDQAFLYISGGTGAAEAVMMTAGMGTCTSAAASGTVVFTPANNHSGTWTIGPASGGIQEAVCDLPSGGGAVVIPANVTLYANIGACLRTNVEIRKNAGVIVSGSFSFVGQAGDVHSLAGAGPLLVVAPPASASLTDYVSGVTNKPIVDPRQYNFAPQTPGTTLTAGGSGQFIPMAPCPAGMAGASYPGPGHWFYISGGTGTAEAVQGAGGGTCNSGSPSGTLAIFPPTYSHSGSWTIQSATAGISEALYAFPPGTGGMIMVPAGTYDLYAPITIPAINLATVPGYWIAGQGRRATMFNSHFTGGPIFAALYPGDGLRLTGFNLAGTGTGSNFAISLVDQSYPYLQDIGITAFGGGVSVTGDANTQGLLAQQLEIFGITGDCVFINTAIAGGTWNQVIVSGTGGSSNGFHIPSALGLNLNDIYVHTASVGILFDPPLNRVVGAVSLKNALVEGYPSPGYSNSTDTVTIGTGSKSFVTQAGYPYSVGTAVRVFAVGNDTNWMDGTVTSYSGSFACTSPLVGTCNTLVVNVTATNGSGSINNWYIGLAGVHFSAYGVGFAPKGGIINTVMFTGGGANGYANYGVAFVACDISTCPSGSGYVEDISFNQFVMFDNNLGGVANSQSVAPVRNLTFTDCLVEANGSGHTNTYDGGYFQYVTGLKIKGGKWAAGAYGNGVNSQRNGISVYGSNTNVSIRDVTVTPNLTKGIDVQGTGNTYMGITGNAGYNPIGAFTLTCSGSPCTLPATPGGSPAMLYIDGGSFGVTRGGANVCNGGTCSVLLGPGQQAVLTYSGGAPGIITLDAQ